MNKSFLKILAPLVAAGVVSSCGSTKVNDETKLPSETEKTEAVIEYSEQETTEHTQEIIETQQSQALESVSEYADLSNLYGAVEPLSSVWTEHLGPVCASVNAGGAATSGADSFGVYIFPECEITITGTYDEYSALEGRDITRTSYSVDYPVTDTGTGYEFTCSICYPDVVSVDGSLSGREYTLIEEDWNGTDAPDSMFNPRVSCTYQAWDGNTYSAGMLNSPSEASYVYDSNGNPAFIVMENVRLYIPYENAGDLYEAFIEPALSGTMELRGYGAPECFKVRFDAEGVITCSNEVFSHNSYDYDYLIYFMRDDAQNFEGHPALYAVPFDDDSYISWGMQSDPISNRPPDYEVLFEVPVNVNDESEG